MQFRHAGDKFVSYSADIKLKSAKDWGKWYQELKSKALNAEVWQFITSEEGETQKVLRMPILKTRIAILNEEVRRHVRDEAAAASTAASATRSITSSGGQTQAAAQKAAQAALQDAVDQLLPPQTEGVTLEEDGDRNSFQDAQDGADNDTAPSGPPPPPITPAIRMKAEEAVMPRVLLIFKDQQDIYNFREKEWNRNRKSLREVREWINDTVESSYMHSALQMAGSNGTTRAIVEVLRKTLAPSYKALRSNA
ncbi:hypothetical protein MN608_05444 [Microdochium nivale]|nr:hypothetical protein MN608_05444 [Microdochium nivale]